MTDELAGSAPAPAEAPAAAPAETSAPAEVSRAEPTPRSAIDRAFEAVDRAERDTAQPEAKAEPVKDAQQPAGERERNADGTFKAKDPVAQPATTDAKASAEPAKTPVATGDAPARFASDKDATAAWAQTPDAVKAATTRVIREMEQGIEKYRGDATTYQQVFKPYVDLALKSKLDPGKQLEQYVRIDSLLAQDFDKGLAAIFQNKGITPREWAAKVMGQPVDQAAASQDKVAMELRTEIAGLKRQIEGLGGHVEQQRQQGIRQSLDAYMASLPEADKALFQELDAEIAAELANPSVTLAQAFATAKQNAEARYSRMFPRPAPTPAAAQTRAIDPAAQTRAGELSIAGAPGAGSDPDRRKPPSSPRAALDRAFDQFGL